MEFYSAPECAYTFEGNHIKTDGSVMKKVTGTSMGGILTDAEGKPLSPWSTPFQVACNLLGLAKKDISMKKSVQRGIALEPKIINYADHKWSDIGAFLSAEEVFAKREGDHDSWKSDFEDEIFAGHVDGLVLTEDGDYILEIKTTTNLDSWANGVPEYYFWQVAIYNHFLTQKDKVYFVLGIASDVTDRDPASWVATDDTCILFEKAVDQELVDQKMEEITEWYTTYIANGVTPDYDPNDPGDVELYNHLKNVATTEAQRTLLVDSLVAAQADIDEIRAREGLDVKEEYVKTLTAQLKDIMVTNGLNSMSNRDGSTQLMISKRTSTSWDTAKMVADGIDTAKYQLEKTTYAIRTKKN